jgi:hypothetical protein
MNKKPLPNELYFAKLRKRKEISQKNTSLSVQKRPPTRARAPPVRNPPPGGVQLDNSTKKAKQKEKVFKSNNFFEQRQHVEFFVLA